MVQAYRPLVVCLLLEPRIHYAGALYYVISRGNRRERIFRNQADFERVSISPAGKLNAQQLMFELGKGEEKKILNNSGRQRLLREVFVQGDNFRYTRCFVKDTLCLPVRRPSKFTFETVLK